MSRTLQIGYFPKPQPFLFLQEHQEKVKCLSCGEIVTVKMMPWADGYAATCTKCNKIAY